jgi:hypothetical protein
LAPMSPCGDLHMERLERIRMRQDGDSEAEIDEQIQKKIEDTKTKLQDIANVLDNLPFNLGPNVVINSAPITTRVFEKSVDATFNALGKNYLKAIEEVLRSILVNPLGDACIAFYQAQTIDIQNSLNLGETQIAIDKQLSEQIPNEVNPLLFLQNTKNFFARYAPFPTSEEIRFEYQPDSIVQLLFGTNGIFIGKSTVKVAANNTTIEIPIPQEDALSIFVEQTSRDTAFETVLRKNNSTAFERVLNNGFREIDIVDKLYTKIKEGIQKNIGQTFFFAEFDLRPNVKVDFSKLDFLNLEPLKAQVKQELNG